jgi:stage II sporulation protein D
VRRKEFLIASGAFAAIPRVARATGGLDIENAESNVGMRVLLASGSFAPPEPLDAWRFAWDGRTYRGTFASVRLPDGATGLVNTVPLDAYLYGVLGKEISPSWPHASQQAQAIASRTYALLKLRPDRPYDVVAAESDQHYGGIEGESVECRAAIDATAAQIVTYGNLPARVAYSSCCGGRTANAADVWKTPQPYLTSVVDPYCSDAPNFDWTVDIGSDDITNAFRARFDIGDLRDVRVEMPAPDARPTDVTFVGSSSTFDATPAEVRNAIGPAVVRSTYIRSASVGRSGGVVTISGTGRGHGVGLCQWGCRGLGLAGASAAAIVAFYFPGTALGRA